jgi:hypothetical protein
VQGFPSILTITGIVGNVRGIAGSIQGLYDASSAGDIIGSVISLNATYIGWITGKVSSATLINVYVSAPTLIANGCWGDVTGILTISTSTFSGNLISGSSYLGGLVGYVGSSLVNVGGLVKGLNSVLGTGGYIGGVYGYVNSDDFRNILCRGYSWLHKW